MAHHGSSLGSISVSSVKVKIGGGADVIMKILLWDIMTAATPTVATGGASLEGLTDLLECSVCLEPLGSQHRVLPCQHTFCLPCLEDLVAKHKKLQGGVAASSQGGVASNVLFLCPECRAEVTTPIQNLPTNVILNRLLSGINQQGPSPKTTPTHPPKRVPPPPLAIGDHRKLPFPSPKDNNNIPGIFTHFSILSLETKIF